jgi:hypothetical protein
MATSRLYYARALIQGLGAPRKTSAEMALVAVMVSEGSRAAWNPLDTTLEVPGATAYNSFGPHGEYHVWNYPDSRAGVEATLATMRQANMSPWVTAIRRGTLSAEDICRAYAEVPWSGIGDLLPLEIVLSWRSRSRTYKRDADSEVWGAGPWAYTRTGKPV